MFEYAAGNNIPTVVMHSNSVPAQSNDFTTNDIVEEVYKSLEDKINRLIESGMDRGCIIADIGIGFGKSKESCFELLRRIEEFTSLKVPLLLGISRKSFMCNGLTCEESDNLTAVYSAMLKSVNIHRVHNASLTKKFLDYSANLNQGSFFN